MLGSDDPLVNVLDSEDAAVVVWLDSGAVVVVSIIGITVKGSDVGLLVDWAKMAGELEVVTTDSGKEVDPERVWEIMLASGVEGLVEGFNLGSS
jgi:hypothetical protein